jgi:RNA polymerase sigma factor (sigma-70 family)
MVTPRVQELVRNGLHVVPDREEPAPRPHGDPSRLELVAIVHSARDGDKRAWEELVARLEPRVRRVARGFRLSASDVDDVVQHTWLKLLENIDKINDPACLPGWLATTARRMCLDVLQARMREMPVDEVEVRGEEPSCHDVVIAAERRHVVRRAVSELPRRQRRLVTLMTQGPDRAYAELANTLQMPVGSIGPTYGRSVQRLRQDHQVQQLHGE